MEEGVLTLYINNIEQFSSQKFEKGEEVIDKCFSSFDSIIVQGPSGDAWLGEIQVKNIDSNEYLSLFCSQGCKNSRFNGKIVVDGNADAQCNDRTCCLNGKSCTIKGKKAFYERF